MNQASDADHGGDAGDGPRSPEGQRLIDILSLREVRYIAWGSAVLLIVWGGLFVFWPQLLASPVARFFALALFSFFFAMFVFILYPMNLQVPTGTIVAIAATVSGPMAVWFILFLFVASRLETNSAEEYFAMPAGTPFHTTTTFLRHWPGGNVPKRVRVASPFAQGGASPTIEGWYLEFPPEATKFVVEVGVGPSANEASEHYELIFERGAGQVQVKEKISATGGS